MTTSYDPNSPLPAKYQRIRKLLISIFSTGAALVTWLSTQAHSPEEIAGAVIAFGLTNYTIYKTPNAE